MLVLLDWDDTVATGPMTWALSHALPGLVAEFGLPRGTLDDALLRAQRAAATTYDEAALMASFLADVGWPAAAATILQRAIVADFEPELFPDVAPFLSRLSARGAQVIVVSNNNHAPAVAARLGLADLRFVTPSMGYARKPSPDMLRGVGPIEPFGTLMVGDDPFSDLPFAVACGLQCSIVDRFGRYRSLALAHQVATTLGEILP